VLSALWSGEPSSGYLESALFKARGDGGLVICAAVYCAAIGAHNCLGAGSADVKGSDCVLLRFVRVEQGRQMREFENFTYMFRNVAELHVSAHLTGPGQAADHRAQAAAVDECEFAQMQYDGTAVAQQPGNVLAQGVALATGNNPPVATHNGYASNLTRVER
jgi:hypothetical protein